MGDLEDRMFSIASSIEALGSQTTGLQAVMEGASKSKFWTILSRSASGILPGFWAMQNKLRAVSDGFVLYYQTQEKGNKRIMESIEAQIKLNDALGNFNEDLVASSDKWEEWADEAYKAEMGSKAFLSESEKTYLGLTMYHKTALAEVKEYETVWANASDYINEQIKKGNMDLDPIKDKKAIEKLKMEEAQADLKPILAEKKGMMDKAKERQIRTKEQQKELAGAENPLQAFLIKKKHQIGNFFKLIGPVLKSALKMMAGALLWGTIALFGLLVIVSIIKRMWPFIETSRKMIINMLTLIVSGLVDVVSGIWGMVAGALTGDWSKFWEGLKQTVWGVVQMLLGIAGVVLLTPFLLFFEYIIRYIGQWYNYAQDTKANLKALIDGGTAILSSLFLIIGAILLIAKISSPWGWALLAIGVGIEALMGIVGRADGGTVAEPITLVGEKGPELVSLPRGAQVYPNEESTEMLKEEEPTVEEINTTNITENEDNSVENITNITKNEDNSVENITKNYEDNSVENITKNEDNSVENITKNEDNSTVENVTNLTEHKSVENVTNITVQIQGRVGASDAEIKDIANKVAHQINMRMNRTLSTPTRFA